MTLPETNMPPEPAAAPRFLPLLLLLFLGSGCAALIYEIVWLQLLQLVIGSSAVSLGLLLGTFMGGMCLGSLALARIIPQRCHPLRVYALLESGMALLGVTVLFAVPALGRLYAPHAGQGLTGLLLRGVVASVCLLPPTFLMGATLPGDFPMGGNHAARHVLAGSVLRRQYRRRRARMPVGRILSAAGV